MANKNNVRKKPTAKEMASAIIEINNRVNGLHNVVKQLDSILGLYIEMKGDKKQFNAYVDKRYDDYMAEMEKNDTKKDENADKPNLQGNTEDEGSGAKGVRKEE
tara:strand:- start:352 stop:663 length:312 start_codon:yes stop_codon:yes gene_type:complete